MTDPSLFTFCPHCCARLTPQFAGDREHRRCHACDWIQYRNPTVGVAVILVSEGKLLLGLRRDGGWCIPCGHVEWDESIEDAAVREMREEVGLEVELRGVVAVKSNFHDRHRQTVGVWFEGRSLGGVLKAGDDLRDARYFEVADLPALSFPTDQAVVALLRRDRKML